MELLRKWDTVQTTLEEFHLPATVEKAVRWMENHPRAVVATAAVLLVAVLLAQTPGQPTGGPDAYNDETPLFV